MKTVQRLSVLCAGVVVGLAGFGFLLNLTASPTSDSFWATFATEGAVTRQYDSLVSLRDDADVIVVATVESVSLSRQWTVAEELGEDGIATYVLTRLLVDETVKGEPKLSAPGSIDLEIFLPSPSLLEAALASKPLERAVYFLQEKVDIPGTYMLSSPQAYIRDFGKAGIPADGQEPWLEDLAESSFEEFLEGLRQSLK